MDAPEPRALPFQPRPLLTLMGHLTVGPVTVTAITRRWRPGDARRCRLCPAGCCTARADLCTVLVGSPVPRGQGALFSTTGLAWQGPGTPFGLVLDDTAGGGDREDNHPVFRNVVLPAVEEGGGLVSSELGDVTPGEINDNG